MFFPCINVKAKVLFPSDYSEHSVKCIKLGDLNIAQVEFIIATSFEWNVLDMLLVVGRHSDCIYHADQSIGRDFYPKSCVNKRSPAIN